MEDYAACVEEFLQARLVDRLGVDTDRVFTTGLSGGSDFAASFHFHTDYRYSGGAVALCGGDIPRLNGGSCEPDTDPDPAPAPTGLSAADLDRVRYDLAITSDDFLLAHTEAATAFYTDAGFTHVRHRIEQGLDYVDPATIPG